MKKIISSMIVLCSLWLAATPAVAQQTTGSITGRILDDQGASVPGVTVTGKNLATGFVRTDVSDAEGVFRLTALPVGSYDLTAELAGFSRIENKGIVVNVGQTLDLNLTLKLAAVSETISVRAETPLIQTSSSSVGGVVDVSRLENLPLNGRQFANAALSIPGVGLGFHSDPTKSTQYSPQIGGGNGRNVNYQIDGGDNNDDTVGGLLQLFPLEAIQEFNFVTQRYKAEYGRSNGGVMNIVTKSGTNDFHGSWFTSMRNTDMNSKTFSEKLNNVGKGEYERYQYGGSFGGPIMQNKAHFFAAYERTQQDTTQSVNTLGLYPGLDGVFPTPMRENLFTAKGSANLTPTQYLSVRYGRNTNSQVYGASTRRVADSWGDSTNSFNSINLNHNWVLGGSKLNEFVFQYRGLRQPGHGADRRSAAIVPERRHHRLQHQHAADDRAEEVAVPRRLLVEQDGHGRPRARLQGRRELHQRAAPVRDVLVGQHRLRLYPPGPEPERTDQHREPQQAGRVSQPPDEAVRHVLPGRLARERPSDGQRRAAV